MNTIIIPIICDQVIISLTADTDEKLAAARALERQSSEPSGITLSCVSGTCRASDIAFDHMYIWSGKSSLAVNAAGCLRYLIWAAGSGTRPVIRRLMNI